MKLNMSKKLSLAIGGLILAICISLGIITIAITSFSLKKQAEFTLQKTTKNSSYQILSIVDRKLKILTLLTKYQICLFHQVILELKNWGWRVFLKR